VTIVRTADAGDVDSTPPTVAPFTADAAFAQPSSLEKGPKKENYVHEGADTATILP
jgi:hypothetical protein